MSDDTLMPPKPPPIERRLALPGLLLLRAGLVSALPMAALFGLLGADATRRVLGIALVFVVLLAIFRVLGKRELGRLSPFELVTLMLVPEVLSNFVQGQDSWLPSLAGLSALLCLVLSTSVLAHRFQWFERVVEAQPTLLVVNGRIIEHALNAERIAPDELYSEMRKQGFADLSRVKWAILEPGGDITFVPRTGSSPELGHGKGASGFTP
jgi:uncharacterized membrane protein YcaP (DUF421 family)